MLAASTSRGTLFISDSSGARLSPPGWKSCGSEQCQHWVRLPGLTAGFFVQVGSDATTYAPCGGAAGQCGGLGHWWWLWELLGLASDLSKALAFRKDTASSHVSSAATELTVSVMGRVAAWGLGGHLAMVSTVNTILHKEFFEVTF